MRNYVLRRLALMVPTLFGVSILVFSMVRFLPGDVLTQMLGEYRVSIKTERDLRHKMGLDRPAYQQYASFVGDVANGSLGRSLRSDRTVWFDLRQRLPVTFELGILAILCSLTIAIPIGVLSALRQDTWVDYVARTFSI